MNLFDDEEDGAVEEGFLLAEDLPAAGLLSPKDSDFCLGFDKEEQEFLKLFNSGKMPHALIFAGAEGIGKFTYAYRVARFLLSQEVHDPNQDALFGEPEPMEAANLSVGNDHPTFRRIAAGGHADFLLIERKYDEGSDRYKDSVEVSEVRRVAPFLRKTAAEGGWRVVIVNDADTMNRNAQNAILKILEEPPANTLLILVAHRPGALIPTIRSRARVMNFSPLGADDFSTLIGKQGHVLSNQELQALYTLSEASVGRALDLLDNGGLDMMGKVIAVFQDYPEWKWSQIHVVAEDLGRSSSGRNFSMFKNVMQWIAAQLVKSKARAVHLPDGPLSGMPVFQTMLASSSLERLIEICDTLQGHFALVQNGNLEKRQAVLRAFSIFAA